MLTNALKLGTGTERSMRRLIYALLTILVVGYLGICIGLYVYQRSLIYVPQPRLTGSGTTMMTLPVSGENILVSTRPHDGPKAMIYFGGNSEDVSSNMPGFSAAFPEYAIYLMHYRSYGGISGQPSEEALVADALALFDDVSETHQEIVVIGRSLGSGVAVHLASLRPTAKLVLVTPYDSLMEIAAHRYPVFPVRWLIVDKFESWRYAPLVTAPTLIIAAENDEVIPRSSSDLLKSRFTDGLVSFKVLAGTNHNTITFSREYLPMLKEQIGQ